MKYLTLPFWTMLGLTFFLSVTQAEEREWTSSGGLTIRAEFVSATADTVTVSMKGKTYALELADLSTESQVLVRKLRKIESPEVLAKRTLDTLSKNDYPALTQLGLESLPKEALIEIMVSIRYPLTDEYIRETAQRRGITKEQAEEDVKGKRFKGRTRMAERYQEGIKQISAKRKASFEKVISVGKKQAKIEWSKVSFVRLEGKAYERGGIKGGDYFIIFAYNGSQFKIKLDDCTHHPKHGWFIQHGPYWVETTKHEHATAKEGSLHQKTAHPKPAPNAPSRKLTPEEVVEVLGMRLGEWTAVEKGKTEAFEEFVCRWKIKGKSIVAKTSKGFTCTMFHDPELGVFVGKMVSPDGKEMIRHGRWDRSTRTLALRVVSPQPPPGVVPIMTLKKTEPDTIVSKFVVRKEGEIVFTRDAVITRKKKDFAPKPKLPAIGFSVLDLSNPYFKEMVAAMQAEADHRGAEFLVEDANMDPKKQSDQIDDFIARGVKAIVLVPMGGAVGPAIKSTNSAGIPVFTIDVECTAEGAQITGHVGNDNYQGGQLAGQAMIEVLGPKGGEVLVLGFGGANACVLRVKGFKEVIDAHNQKGEGGAIEIVAEADGGANQGKSQEATGDALIDHPDLAGIFAINDPSALGAYQAAKAAGKEKQVKVIGFDGTKQGRDAIKAGKIYAAPIQFPDRMGRRVIENVFAHLTGKEFNQVEFVPTEIYRQEDALAEEKQASVQAPVAAGSLEDNIRGKRIVFGQIGSKDGILQFNEDGTFKVGQLVWGPSAVSPQRIKFEQEQETATYKVSGLKVSVKADQEDNFITFKNNNPKKGDSIYFGNAPSPFRILRIGSEILYANEVSEIADQTHQQILNPQGFVYAKQKPGMWETSMKIQVKKTSEHEARVIERKSIKLVKHVQGKYVVISTLDETGRHVSKEVISYDTQTKRTHSTFVLRGWMINEGVGVPNTKTNSVDWVSSRLSLDRGVRMNLADKPQFKQIFQTTFAEDGLSFSIQGRGYNKDNKLGAVFTGEYLRIAELPEQDLALTEGVVAYYPFNGNAKDEAGNGHDGTVVGAKLTTDRHGKPNSAYQFKLGDHIKIDGLLGKPKNLSLAAWVKLDGQQGRWGSEIISMGGYVTLRMDNRQSVKNSGTGGLIFSGRTGRSYWVHVMKKANYTGTGWHQVVFTVDDNADKQVTYVDGQKAAAKQNPKSIVYKGSGRNTFFGIHGSGDSKFMSQGVIDDIRIYDRALNTDEVKALFLTEKPATPLQAGKKIKAATGTEKTN